MGNLERIVHFALQLPNKYGETYEKTLCLIAMQESSLGINLLGDTDHLKAYSASYGLFQFRVATVRFVARHHKKLKWLLKMSDAWIANKLIRDTDFNIILAVFHIKYLSERYKEWRYIICAWNGMPKGKVTKYYKQVVRWKPLVYPLVKQIINERRAK